MALTQEQVLERFKKAHGDRYDYSLVDFKRVKDDVIIICKEHGEFPQQVGNHMMGVGCRKCAIQAKTTDEFIQDARKIHGDRYDYDSVDYASAFEYIIITCREHGPFRKIPNAHLNGQGCPKCASNVFRSSNPAVFYIYKSDYFVGFGITNCFNRRSIAHRSNFRKMGIDVVLHSIFNTIGTYAKDLEDAVKKKFQEYILNTGIEGFKTEALTLDQLEPLLTFVRDYLENKTPPEGGVSEAITT